MGRDDPHAWDWTHPGWDGWLLLLTPPADYSPVLFLRGYTLKRTIVQGENKKEEDAPGNGETRTTSETDADTKSVGNDIEKQLLETDRS